MSPRSMRCASASGVRSLSTISSARSSTQSGTVSRTVMPVRLCTLGVMLSTCWMFSVESTSISASRSCSTSWKRLACRLPSMLVCASSSISTTSGLRARIASTSISSNSVPLYSSSLRGTCSSCSASSAVRARRIAKLVKAGKLQIGPWYLLADSFLASGEALIRNLEIGSRIARRFGKSAQTGYLPDQFRHAAQLPQILSGFGLKAAVVFRGVGREVNRNRFIWEALDGSSLFTIFLPFGYSNGANLPTDSADAMIARADRKSTRERKFSADAPILVMNGNDHAEPDPIVFERLKEAAGRAPFNSEVGTLDDYAKRLSELPRDGTPRVRGELRSPARSNITPGVSSTRAWIKQRDFQRSEERRVG